MRLKSDTILSFLLLIPFLTFCQNTDLFDQGSLDTLTWKGNVEDYRLDDGRLRLDAPPVSGKSILFTKVEEILDSMQWNLDIELDFDPSSQNFLNVWFLTDHSSLEFTNGYYVSIGESGSEDALTIYKRENQDDIIVAIGKLGRVAKKPILSLTIKSSGVDNYELQADYQDGGQETITFSADDVESQYFIIECIYTSSRADKFYFDNYYAGPHIKDTEPPSVIDFAAEESSIVVDFNEDLDSESITNDKFRFTPDFAINAIILDEANSLSITGTQPFEKGVAYTLDINGVRDLSDNSLDTSIMFTLLDRAESEDILINEILFNPRGSGSDFVEIVNITSRDISLEDIFIGNRDNGQSEKVLFPSSIRPGEYIVLTEDLESLIQTYTSHERSQIFEQDLPSFNNDNGNVSIGRLMDGDLKPIDTYDYSEKDHHPLLDDEDGVSLERISLMSPTDSKANWASASSIIGFATPGLINSASGGVSVDNVELIALNKTFSPNADGNDDEALFSYEITEGFVGNATVYDLVGNEIFRIWSNATLPTKGTITWNGQDKSGQICPEGIYIIVFELFNLEGAIIRKKEDVVLARR